MSDLISRQAAIDALVRYTHLTWEHLKIIYPMLNVFEKLPSAERHGRWEKVDDNPYEYVAVCSVCRNEVKQPTCMLKPIYSYCPICGARMVNEDA